MFRSKKRIEFYKFGPFRLDLVVRRLYFQDKPVPLPAKTFDILKILVEHLGQAVTKEELIRQVWVNQFVAENNLTVRISALRKTLGEDTATRYIETVSGHGYRFVAKVREMPDRRSEPEDEALTSLAVLPLVNENNQQRLNYLCDGITESLINSLSQVANLKVMSRSTVFRFKKPDIDPLLAGKDLGVEAVLIGNLKQLGSSILLNVEMVDVNDGARLWGAVYQRQVTDLFAIQEEIAKEMSDSLRLKLSKAEESRITKRHTDSTDAYHLYLKGRYFASKRSVLGAKRSIDYFRKAIKQDPQYALAYTGLTDAYIMIAGYGLEPPRKIMPKAQAAALKALEIDDRLAEAYVSLGLIKSNFEWDWSGGESMFKRAIELSPNSAAAHHYYAMLLAKCGRLDQALAEIRKAFELDPLSVHIHLAITRILYFMKQYDAAVEHCEEMLELDPQFSLANGLIGLVYLEQKNYERAITEFKKMMTFSGGDHPGPRGKGGSSRGAADPEALGVLGYAYGVAGERAEAQKLLNRLKNLTARRYVEPYTLALVYLGLGEYDQVFEWLEKAYDERTNVITYLKVWPLLNRLGGHSQYEDLVTRLGL